MNKYRVLFLAALIALLLGLAVVANRPASSSDFVSYKADLNRENLRLYWNNEQNQRFKSLGNLNNWLAAKDQKLVFAMNAGMFNPSYSPQGLFIQGGKTITPLDTTTGKGNFYLKPNGVFFTTTDNTAGICQTADFISNKRTAYATQSGPMLLIDGKIHPAFQPGSTNLQIRNGVGILPDNRLLFVMSKSKLSFYDFATYFKQAGCQQALYLDGFVSRTYAPAQNWTQTDGDFGVIIGVTVPKQQP